MPEQQPILSRRRTFWTLWTVAWLVCWVGLFTVTHVPIPKEAGLPFRWGDKVVHFGIFFALAVLGGRAAQSRKVSLSRNWVTRWTVIYAIYAAADELLQPFVGRNCSFSDWLADVLGAVAGLGVMYWRGKTPVSG